MKFAVLLVAVMALATASANTLDEQYTCYIIDRMICDIDALLCGDSTNPRIPLCTFSTLYLYLGYLNEPDVTTIKYAISLLVNCYSKNLTPSGVSADALQALRIYLSTNNLPCDLMAVIGTCL